jgi:hypothetical protein
VDAAEVGKQHGGIRDVFQQFFSGCLELDLGFEMERAVRERFEFDGGFPPRFRFNSGENLRARLSSRKSKIILSVRTCWIVPRSRPWSSLFRAKFSAQSSMSSLRAYDINNLAPLSMT